MFGVPGQEKECDTEKKICEHIIAKNIPKLAKEINLQIQEPQQSPNRENSKEPMSTHIIFKLLKRKTKKIH